MVLIRTFELLFAIYILMISYLLFKAVRRKFINKRRDKEFAINTMGYRYMDNQKLYNRTESTPYLALETLADKYVAPKGSRFVDVGAGKGRVSIFVNHAMGIPVTGIEINEVSFNEAQENLRDYGSKFPGKETNVGFAFEYAEKYLIKEKDNIFFFFNPFHVNIFKKVVDNIISSADNYKKEVYIILYYPMDDFDKYLKEETDFEVYKRFNTKGMISRREKIVIYRYKPITN